MTKSWWHTFSTHCVCVVCLFDEGTAVWYQVDVMSMSDVLLMSSVHTVKPLTATFPAVSQVPHYNAVSVTTRNVCIEYYYASAHWCVGSIVFCCVSFFVFDA